MDAYTAMGNVLLRWDANPKAAKASQLAPYVTPLVLRQTLASYKYMAQHGLAYRGTPDATHLKIIVADQSSVVFTNCLTPSRTDPYTQYVVASGKAVPTTGPPGLHPKAVTVIYSGGRWRVSEVVPNLAKTCSP